MPWPNQLQLLYMIQITSHHLLPRLPLNHPPLLTSTASSSSSFINNARGLHLPPHFLPYPAFRPRRHGRHERCDDSPGQSQHRPADLYRPRQHGRHVVEEIQHHADAASSPLARRLRAAFCGCGEGDGVAEALFEVLEAGFRLQGEEGGAFFVAADGAVEGVEVGLEDFADLGG